MAAIIRSSLLIFLLLLPIGNEVRADDQRAHINYMIHCQGCHLPNAVGVPGAVPRMKNFMAYFLHSQKGREFLVRVPGVSTASLPNDEIAELLNWLVETYSGNQMPDEFSPYTVDEVARLRKEPEADPEKTRQLILQDIAAGLPALAEELASGQ